MKRFFLTLCVVAAVFVLVAAFAASSEPTSAAAIPIRIAIAVLVPMAGLFALRQSLRPD